MAKRTGTPTKKAKAPREKSRKGGSPSPAHYRLSPSSAYRWLVCPYSAQHDLPDTSGPAAKAGTVAHELACSYLKGEIDTLLELEDSIYESARRLVPDRAANIAKSASAYVEYVQNRVGDKVFETKIEHGSIPDFGGTIDTAILDGSCLSVDDLKTGKWKVSAENNPQLMSYLCLARQIFPDATEFKGSIFQYGRAYGASFSGGQLDIFEQQVKIAGKSDKKQNGEHCRFCPLRPKCEEGTEYARGKGW
jgi:hypothetical protein